MQVQKIELTGLGFGGDFAAEESYKTLLSNIQFCGGDVKLISITSCFPNEGKTTISIELSRELAEAGVGLADTLDDAASGTVIIRAHGVVPQVIDAARERGLDVVDATCPYVKKVHVAAERLVREGYRVIVVGEPGHPEVEGILGHAGDDAQVVSCAADADALALTGKVGLVVQTTQTAQNLAEVVSSITPRVQELRVINTICAATSERQQAAASLANRCDCMVVVGGKNSGNTRRLAQLCADVCEHTHHIEEASELEAAWFADARHIGITAGASTPQEHIERAVARIKELCR